MHVQNEPTLLLLRLIRRLKHSGMKYALRIWVALQGVSKLQFLTRAIAHVSAMHGQTGLPRATLWASAAHDLASHPQVVPVPFNAF